MVALVIPESTLTLREYQHEAIEAVESAWSDGVNPTAVVLPTGMGKTVIFSALTARYMSVWGDPSEPPVILVHRDELAQQAAGKLRAMLPDHLRVGIVKAEHNEVDADVIVASVQTLANPKRRAPLMARGVGMVVVDECHHAWAPTYRDTLVDFGAYSSDPVPCVGFTATLQRGDLRGLGDVFASVAYTRDIMYGIRNGYLSDVRGLSVVSEGIDLSRVKRTRGDYSESELGHVMEQDLVTEAVADAYDEHGRDERGRYRRGVLFTPTVESAHAMALAFNKAGIPCEVVSGTTPLDERARIYRRFEHGETRVLANCMVLTEGWDAPHAEVCVVARPTTSAGLYQQMVGRVLRPFPGKREALVLDVVGAAKMHKLASLIDLSTYDPRPGESLVEAAERAELEDEEREVRSRGPKFQAGGELAAVNLFAESDSAWLQTRKGVWFISAGELTFFIWEFPDGSHGVASYAKGTPKPQMLKQDMPLSLAMAVAEGMAMNTDHTLASRKASWRKRNEPASDAQKVAMTRMNILVPDGITKRAASDLISIKSASDRIDIYVK